MLAKLFLSICVVFLTIQKPVIGVGTRYFDRSVIGGVNAEPGEAKFQVQVRMNYLRKHSILFYSWTTEETTGFCGGSLLDSTTVITAAHCTELPKYVS